MHIIINEKYYAFQSDFGTEEYLKCAICEMSDLISYSNDISHVSYGHFKIMSKTTLDEYELEHDGFTKISSGDSLDSVMFIHTSKNNMFVLLPNDIVDRQRLFEIVRWHLAYYVQLILEKQYKYVLHASVVEQNNRLVFIFGDSHAGKTTSMLRLMKNGYHFISDDKVAVSVSNGGLIVTPIYPYSVQVRQGVCRQIANTIPYFEPSRDALFNTDRFRIENDVPLEIDGRNKCIICCFLSRANDFPIVPLRNSEEIVRNLCDTTILLNNGFEYRLNFIHACNCIAKASTSYSLNAFIVSEDELIALCESGIGDE